MSPVLEGDVFAFWGSRELRLVFVVVELGVHDAEYAAAKVLLLDVTENVEGFRASPGQTTGWCFNVRDPEWSQLVRLS